MLSRVMHLDGCHLCKSPYPRNAMTVDAKTKSIRYNFHGQFDIIIHAAFSKTGGADEEEMDILDISSQILFRIPPVVVRVISCVDLFEYKNKDSLCVRNILALTYFSKFYLLKNRYK